MTPPTRNRALTYKSTLEFTHFTLEGIDREDIPHTLIL
jgi:hypothetical protein